MSPYLKGAVVVGVDGSDGARGALAHGAWEAHPAGSTATPRPRLHGFGGLLRHGPPPPIPQRWIRPQTQRGQTLREK
jgi:hypothetical protein